MRTAVPTIALVVVLVGLAAATSSGASVRTADGAPPNRVTMITDSVGGVLYWEDSARAELAQGLDLQLETKTCRRLVVIGCSAYGERPPSALQTIQSLGSQLGPIVVIDVGYNDDASTYAAGLDQVMQALVAANVQDVIWVTLEQAKDYLSEIDGVIRNAPRRWPRLVVADWAPVAAAHPSWFSDGLHMNTAGGHGFAAFLRPIVLDACGLPCVPPPPRAKLLPPIVRRYSAIVRWHGNATAVTYDLETRRTASWKLVASRLATTRRTIEGVPGTRTQVRVRARNVQGSPGGWSAIRTIRFKKA